MDVDGASNCATQDVNQVIPAGVVRIVQERPENWQKPIPIAPELPVEEIVESRSLPDGIQPLANSPQRLISPTRRVAYMYK